MSNGRPVVVAFTGPPNWHNTLHHALSPFLFICRLFGVLPISNVWPAHNVADIRFRWWSLPVVVSAISIAYAVMDLFLSYKVVSEYGLKLYTVGPSSFSIICFISYILFVCLAPKWPDLTKRTIQCERIFLTAPYASGQLKRFSSSIRRFGAILLCGAIVEHLTYVASSVYNNHLQIKECNLTADFWENYFERERFQIFSIVNYSPWLIPVIEWFTIAMTFVWNFVDIFLILICRGITMRFQQMHYRIRSHIKQRMPSAFWFEIRQHFLRLQELLADYDDKLSGLILLSCSHNLYFICIQLFNSFQNKGNAMNVIYFWFSLIFVLTRIMLMMFTAAAIYDEANNIGLTLYDISTDNWCLELKRLHEIINTGMIGLSGKGFFLLTRKLIFAMAGTIVVYELVLIDQVDDTDAPIDYCSSHRL